jgi:hypothetical protein
MRILRHVAVPFWSSSLADARHLPHGRHQAGTATSSSTKSGTTSLLGDTDVIAAVNSYVLGSNRHTCGGVAFAHRTDQAAVIAWILEHAGTRQMRSPS